MRDHWGGFAEIVVEVAEVAEAEVEIVVEVEKSFKINSLIMFKLFHGRRYSLFNESTVYVLSDIFISGANYSEKLSYVYG